jgi:hypothetical protein
VRENFDEETEEGEVHGKLNSNNLGSSEIRNMYVSNQNDLEELYKEHTEDIKNQRFTSFKGKSKSGQKPKTGSLT